MEGCSQVGMKFADSTKLTVINQCHVVAHFALPSVVRHVVADVVGCMRSCLSHRFKLLMSELHESSRTLLKPPQGDFLGDVCM